MAKIRTNPENIVKVKLLFTVSMVAVISMLIIGYKIYSSIESVDSKTLYDHRPKNVPATALWAGGPDGGVFIEVSNSSLDKDGYVNVVLYDDYTGDIIYKGFMKNESNLENSTLNGDVYEGWDGERLHISTGGWLVPIDSK